MPRIRKTRKVSFRKKSGEFAFARMSFECGTLQTNCCDPLRRTFQANATDAADEIAFAANDNRVILTSGQLEVTKSVTIGGSAEMEIARSSAANTRPFRLFDISEGAVVSLNRLTLVNGFENQGVRQS